MNYTMQRSDWQWLITPEPGGKGYRLKYKRPTEWTDCNTFDTPEAAAEAVAKGTTGQMEWDAIKHLAPIPSLAAWLVDPTGGPLSPFVPVVSNLILTAVKPLVSDNGKEQPGDRRDPPAGEASRVKPAAASARRPSS